MESPRRLVLLRAVLAADRNGRYREEPKLEAGVAEMLGGKAHRYDLS
jgi:hypothetical protein